MSDYSALDRLLHRLVLDRRFVAETIFDLDQRIARADGDRVAERAHVFVAGLARAGTTVLMRRLHATGAFRSLTYRDMPFVLAPNLWRRLSATARRDVAKGERAHGDRLEVDADSPESLDEVFWRIFAGPRYLHSDHLAAHKTDAETRARFRAYVAAILSAQGAPPAERYLSKNNNNILRLPAIRRTFPNALLLVPVRAPASHAGSLLRQHRRFTEMQRGDRFVERYMRWLAHHEFGLDHRPFRFGEAAPAAGDPMTIDYWVARWIEAYAWLDAEAPEDTVFVVYEALCADPTVWERVAALAGVPPEIEGDALSASETAPPEGADPELFARADVLYDRLVARSAARLA
ncbi:MAG: sulfotransferase [Paracoccaceae bacterium]